MFPLDAVFTWTLVVTLYFSLSAGPAGGTCEEIKVNTKQPLDDRNECQALMSRAR